MGSEEPENLQRREAVLGSGSQVKFGQEKNKELLSEMCRGSLGFGIFLAKFGLGFRVQGSLGSIGQFCGSAWMQTASP